VRASSCPSVLGVTGNLEKTNSTSFWLLYAQRVSCVAAAFVAAAGVVVAVPVRAQDAGTLCPASGFDLCFPNLDAGAPNAACDATAEGAAVVGECLSEVCSAETAEPVPGFFNYCCAQGGSVRYDDFCVFVVQSACLPVADHCADRCPPLELLTGTVPLAPPPEACLASYPSFIRSVCSSDPFCCNTSWDEICARTAAELSGGI
jgi:hypothetical protein